MQAVQARMGAEERKLGGVPRVPQPVLEQAESRKAKTVIRPSKSKVLLRRLEPPNKSAGGIFIPTSGTEELQSKFRVLAIGAGVTEPTVGQCVLANTFAGTDMVHNGTKLKMLPASDVLAVFDHSE